MAEGRKRLIQATKSILSGKQDKPRLFPAVLGAYVDGIKQLKVASRPDFVWCRMRGSTSEVIQAFNESVALHWDLPVLVFRDPLAPGIWKVYGRDIAQYDDWAGASYLPPHGDAHSFGGSSNTGIDPVWVFKRQYMPMLPRPVVSGTLSIFIEADFWYYQGRYYWWPGSGTTSLAPYMPTGALNGAFVTVYMDGAKKIPQFIKGPEFSAWYPPSDPADFITLPTPAQGPPLAAVFMTTGTSWIGWGEIYDLRSPAEPLGSLTASGSFVAHDEGLLLGSVTHINFVGAGVSATISGSYVTVNVPNVMPGGLVGWDHGVVIGTGTILEVGEGLRMTQSGTVLHIDSVPQGNIDYYLHHTGSSVPAYDKMTTTAVAGDEYYYTSAIATTGTMVADFITDAGVPGATSIPDGVWTLHCHAKRTGGTKQLRMLWQLFLYRSGAEIYVADSEESDLVVAAEGFYEIYLAYDVLLLQAADRLLIKVFGKSSGGGSAPTLAFEVEGDSFSHLSTPGTGGGGTATVNPPITGSFVIEDEGVVLGSATELNFIGAGVTAALVGPRADITIPGGGGSPPTTGSIVVDDEGVIQGSAIEMDFVGAGVTATVVADKATITIPGTVNPPITGSFVVDDEGVVLGSAIEMDFVGAGVTAALLAGKVTVTIPGGGTGPAGPAGAGGVMGWDEGIPLGTGTILNVTGDGAALSLSGTVLELNVPGTFLQDDGAPLGYLAAMDFVGAGVTATLVGSQATVTIPGGGVTPPPVTGSFVIAEEGSVLGSATELNFIGAAVTAALVGPRANITITASGGGGYPRCAVPILLAGDYYQVPDYPYLTGSLMVFTNGVAQRPVIDFIEWSAISGIFQYVTSPPTGASHVAYYGK